MNFNAPQKSLAPLERSKKTTELRVGVVGLGQVGIVTAAAMLKDGNDVVGVDNDPYLLELVSQGRSPFREPEVDGIISDAYEKHKFSASHDVADVIESDLIFVCVGTRGLPNGELDLSDVLAAARSLGAAVRSRATDREPLLIVFRSTMLPGSLRDYVLPAIIAAAGEEPGQRFEVAYLPEFGREGSALSDHYKAGKIVIGERRPGSAPLLSQMFENFEVPTFITSFETAELAKFADNSFHALKVAFANEIGRFALRAGAPPQEVFEIFRSDTKLNISPAYLTPGAAFGGPCLKKDVQALATRMKETGIAAPILQNIYSSNERHTDFLVAEIEKRVSPPARLLLVGLSFKSNTDDLRDSALIVLAEALVERGYRLSIYDPDLLSAPQSPEFRTQLLPSELRPLLYSSVPPTGEHWDLAVVAKHALKSRSITERAAAVFRIDRL